jgi:hypothetical protein
MDNPQQSKPDPNSLEGKAITSLKLAIIALLLLFPALTTWLSTTYHIISREINLEKLLYELLGIEMGRWPLLLEIFFVPIIAVGGLILGGKGLSSTKRKWAILGILLCILSLLLWLPIAFEVIIGLVLFGF